MNRRDFLKKAAKGVGFGLVTPYVISSGVLSAPGRPGANDRIALGHIGLGRRGTGLVRLFAREASTRSIAVADPDAKRRASAAGVVGKGCAAYTDYRDLLDRKDIDAVVIATPDHWHALQSIHACEARKDVYCEKPLSLTVEEARTMVTVARRYKRVFQTGSQQRSSPEFRRTCELVRSGRIGKLHAVRVEVWGTPRDYYLPAQRVPDWLNWDLWLGPAPRRPYHTRRHLNWGGCWDYSGGGMTGWGSHHLDIVQWGLDMDHSGPVEVFHPKGKAHVVFKYASGVVVLCGRVGANAILFEGTEGKIEVNRGHFRTWPEKIGKEPLDPKDVHLFKSPGHQKNWLNCIRTRKRPICDVEIGCRSIIVCHLGNIAVWLGRKLRWSPEKERFVGDELANRWLSRPMRAPLHL